MKIKKPIVKIMQIGTLFIFTSLSFLGVISFSQPEVSNFWTIKKLNFSFLNTSFAESGDNNRNDDDNGNENRNDNDDNDDNDNSESQESGERYSNPIIVNPVSTPPVVQTPVTNTTTTQTTNTTGSNCKTITETIYDTVTSASGTTSQVPRNVSKQVCDTIPVVNEVKPVVVPVVKSEVIQTPAVIKPISNSNYKDGTYIGNGKYSFPGGAIDYSVKLIVSQGKITNAEFIKFTESGNGKYTRAQGDLELANLVSSQNTNIDTVTGASGTSKAIQDAINDALSTAKSQSTTIVKPLVETTTKPLVKDKQYYQNIKKQILANILSTKKETLYKALNGKTYTIINDGQKFEIKKSDGTYAKKSFNTYNEAVNYLNSNNTPTVEKYKASNGKIYSIMIENGKVVIKKSDGTYAKKTFITYDEAKIYLNQNAPKTVMPIVTIKPKITPTITIKPKVTQPIPVVTKPVIDTTTKAS